MKIFISIFFVLSTLFTVPVSADIFETRISVDLDDVEETVGSANDGNIAGSDNRLNLGYEVNNQQIVGFRFANVAVPADANITNAYLEFTPIKSNSGATSLIIKGELADNAAAFRTTDFDVSTRLTTSSFVNWDNLDAWVENVSNAGTTASGLTDIVQELVDQAGWASNNAMVFMVSAGAGCTNTNCERRAFASDKDTTQSALLHIEYTPPPMPPIMGIITDSDVYVSFNFSYDLSAFVTPTNGDAILNYTLSGTLPTGLEFNTTTGVINGIATVEGTFPLTASATDKDGVSNVSGFTITSTTVIPPVADYHLDECYYVNNDSTLSVLDSPLNGLDGMSFGDVVKDDNGQVCTAAGGFNSTNLTWLDIPDNAAINNLTNITVMAWVYPTAFTNYSTVIIKTTDNNWNDGWGLIADNGRADLQFYINGYNTNFSSRVPVPLDQWSHVAATYDGSQILIYLNGQQVGTPTVYTTPISNATTPMFIGHESDPGSNDEWEGSLDEVKVYDYALNAVTIDTIYKNELGGSNFDGSTRACSVCSIDAELGMNFIGIPADLRDGTQTVRTVFGDDFVSADYNDSVPDTGWILFKRTYSLVDNSSQYDIVGIDEPLTFGEGYWLGTKIATTWDTDGIAKVDYNSSYSGTADCTANRCVEIDLTEVHNDTGDGGPYRFNFTGFVGASAVNWKDMRFIISDLNGSNVEVLTPEAAELAGYALKQIWAFDNADQSYITCHDTTPAGCVIDPSRGFWILLTDATLNKTIRLLIPQE